jgi:hypothetical protein
MRPVKTNLQFLEAMIQELEAYVLSRELFWPLSPEHRTNGPPFPRMTIGNVLLTLDQLEAQREQFSPSQQAALRKLTLAWQQACGKWRVGLEGKAVVEMRSRLNLWRAYLDDLEHQGNRAGVYTHEVHNRVKFERLADFVGQHGETDPYLESMQSQDARLLPRFSPGEFQWHPSLKQVYPKSTYWYLYGMPRLNG